MKERLRVTIVRGMLQGTVHKSSSTLSGVRVGIIRAATITVIIKLLKNRSIQLAAPAKSA